MRDRGWLLVSLAVCLSACRDGAFSDGDTRLDEPRPVAVLGERDPPFVRVACTFEPTRGVTPSTVATFSPPLSATPESGESPWAPASITAVVAFGGGFVIVDQLGGELVELGPDLSYSRTFARTGEGPNEVLHPVAAHATERRDTLWVLDDRLGALLAYDRSLNEVRRVRLTRPANDFATLSRGGFVLIEPLRFDLLRAADAEAKQRVLTRLSSAGDTVARYWEISAGSLADSRFVLAGPTTGGVASTDSTILVFLRPSGRVDVWRSDERQVETSTCLTQNMREAYARQKEKVLSGEHAPVFSTQWYDHASDARFGPDGRFAVLVGTPTEDGFPHIAVFAADGTPAGSLVLEVSPIETFYQASFPDADTRRIALYDGQGRIWLYDLGRSVFEWVR